MAMDIDQLRKKSVTKDDVTVANASYFFYPLQGLTQRVTIPPDPPAYWSLARDAMLRTTILAESMWSSALAIAITKVQSAGYEIESEVGLRARNGHDLMTYVDFGNGWKRFAAKLARDYLLCDNGAFIEVIHAARSPGSKIVGLAHLDSLRCTRTGDPEIPVLYRDRMGKEHEMQAHQVFDVVDLPDPSETLNGVGVCAASRAYKTIYKLAAVETFISESVSGRSPSKLSFIGGIPQLAVEDAFASAQAEADARGLTSYMGAAVQAALSDKALSLVEIQLREVPEGFNVEQERTDAYLKYANALGIDPQELQPLTGRPLGTATQSQVLDDKQRGKGLSSFFGAFAEMVNLRVLPEATTFMFLENDYRDQQAQAQVKLTRAQTRAAQISSGEITPVQALQMAADEGDVPKEFLVQDATDDDRIADDEKPTEEYDDVGEMAEEPQPEEAQQPPQQQQPAQTMKAARTELVAVAPTIRAKFNTGGESRLVEATKALREYMQSLVEACKEECPTDSGKLAESIRYEVKNANTREPVGHIYAGGKDRPEVAVRSVLFGRRGFGPKKAGGVLVFEGKEGETVYATHVAGTEPNDWFKRAWERTAKERADMARRIGALDTEAIDARDVKLQNAPNVDGYNPDKPDEIPNTKRNRIAGGVQE